jgi:aldose 1-epimerase
MSLGTQKFEFPMFSSTQVTAVALDSFGKCSRSGAESKLYQLFNKKSNIRALISEHGARLVGLTAPDSEGNLDDVVIGFDSVSAYEVGDCNYYGATCGRTAGRIGAGKFTIDSKQYQLGINNGPNNLHGGPEGYSHQTWELQRLEPTEEPSITFTYKSSHLEMGFPGSLLASVKYTLTNSSELEIRMTAGDLSEPTIVNMCNHAFWNLAGHKNHPVLDHKFQ